MNHDFTYIIDDHHQIGEDIDVALFEAGCDDATVALINGSVAVCFTREAASRKDAIVSAYEDISKVDVQLVRFEPDFLVGQSEICDRTGLSKQRVSNYFRGQRKAGFPKPYARVTSPSPLWDWVPVSYWLHENIPDAHITEVDVTNALIDRATNLCMSISDDGFSSDRFSKAINGVAAQPLEKAVKHLSVESLLCA